MPNSVGMGAPVGRLSTDFLRDFHGAFLIIKSHEGTLMLQYASAFQTNLELMPHSVGMGALVVFNKALVQ